MNIEKNVHLYSELKMAIFAPIFTEINNIIQNTIAGNTSALINAVSPIFLSAFIIYLMFIFLSYWQGSNAEGTIVDMVKRVLAWSVVLGFSLNIGAYNDTVLPVILHLGDGLSEIFGGSGNPENGLDTLTETLIMKVNENEQSFSLLGGIDSIGDYIVGIIINMLIIVCMGLFLIVAGAYITITKIFLAMLAVIGPLFIICALFPATRQFFMSWVNQVVNYSFLVLFINILAVVFTTYLSNSISGTNLATNQGVIHIILTSGLFTIALFKLPELSSGLMGGVSSGGFGNVASAASNASRVFSGRGGQKRPKTEKNNNNIKEIKNRKG